MPDFVIQDPSSEKDYAQREGVEPSFSERVRRPMKMRRLKG